VSIRVQLLLVSLTTLILPWAGCQYARELETALRTSQEQALLASAGTIANALSAEPQRLFRDPDDVGAFDAARGDVYAHPLLAQPLLDGYRDDWGVRTAPQPLPAASPGLLPVRMLAGVTDRYLYLYLEVDEPHFRPEPADVHLGRDRFDRVELTLQEPGGAVESFFFATHAPGLIEAQSVQKGDAAGDRVQPEPRLQAYWLQTAHGYHLEARIPRSLVGARLRIEAIGPTGRPAGAPVSGIEAAPSDDAAGGRLFFAPAGLGQLLATFIRTGTRATVVDAAGLKLAVAGDLESGDAARSREAGRDWYRRFLAVDSTHLPQQSTAADRLESASVGHALAGHPDAEWLRIGDGPGAVLSAAAPMLIAQQPRGAVVLEQAGDQLVGLRDQALARLFDLTLLATGVVVAFAFGFATWIGVRIRRLGAAAESAVTSDGRIRLQMPESARADEIGALSRSFERLLARLDEHTRYLRTLGGKLSHELRTPLTVVRSSLDNLESEGVGGAQRVYLNRAREGSLRLQSILTALGAAARVEESFKQAERVAFDLRELLISAVAGYRDGFSGVRFELIVPPDACFLRGAPDLIVQLLDKLVENAVDFCPPGGIIGLGLQRAPGEYTLEVANDGPPIPQAMLGRLFESLFEQRTDRDEKPHLGLGLYIVRLIAEFHGGRAAATNRDTQGARFSVTLPVI
jgi:dedicated sortase system histidine kinase